MILRPEQIQLLRLGLPVIPANDMGKSDPPPPPDYTGAAVATGAANQEAARVAAKANRVSQYTPYGSLVYTGGQNGDPDQWRSDVTLSPTGQALLDSQNKISLGLGNLGETGLGYVQNTLNKPFDWGAVPQAPVNAGTTAQQAIMSRLGPDLESRRAATASRLANQGIGVGTQAYDEALKSDDRAANDARMQAVLQGINLDTTARQQGIQEQSFARNEPLNMLNAVRSGAQVQNPTFQQVPQQATVPGANYLGAAQAQGQDALGAWNAQQAQNNNMMSGLFSLGGSAMMGGFNPFSLGGGNAFGPVAFGTV